MGTYTHPEKHQAELKKATSIEQINQKLFIDEFFDTKSKDLLPKEIKTYDIKNHAHNEIFLNELFKKPESILPIQNLGEMAYIMQKYKEGFTLLDLCMKLYKLKDFDNLLKYKTLSLLGALLDTQGD